VSFEQFEISSHTRRFTYPLWLRFFTLVAGVILVILLAGPSVLFSNSDPTLPWNEEFRINPPGQTPEIQLSDKQPQLAQVLHYKIQPEEGDNPRGTINFFIHPDGNVMGVWNGEYDKSAESVADANVIPDDVHYLIMAASFNGNVDPSKPFPKDGAKNCSNLYFLTRGTYMLLETQKATGGSRSVNGLIYVRGWLHPDYTAIGEVIITKDKRTFETFNWVAQPSN
jgi:hypothetical protein